MRRDASSESLAEHPDIFTPCYICTVLAQRNIPVALFGNLGKYL